MEFKRIGAAEKMLIAECVKEEPSFERINSLFGLGADPNAVNAYGESVLGAIMSGYCGGSADGLRPAVFAPRLVSVFIKNGFDVRRHGMKVISEMENSCYDRHMRRAIKLMLTVRRNIFCRDMRMILRCIGRIFGRSAAKHDPQAA